MERAFAAMVQLMEMYSSAQTAPFKEHPLHDVVRAIRRELGGVDVVRQHPSMTVRASVGMGNWATVPWIAVLDQRETRTTKNGVYVIFLFVADMSGVYLTLNQGITEPMERIGRTRARDALRRRAAAIRQGMPELIEHGFAIDAEIDVRAGKNIASQYADSTIAYRRFTKEDLEQATLVARALSALLDIYESYVPHPIPLSVSNERT